MRIQGAAYRLDKCLENKKKNIREPIVFAVKDHPDIEIVFPVNEWDVFILDFKERTFGCCLELQKAICIDRYGRAYTRERLHHPLHQMKWHRGLKEPCDEDLRQSRPIIQMMQEINTLKFTPHPLHPKHFGFNHSGVMRSTCILEAGKKNFEEREKFLAECVQYDPALFAYLMQATQLEETSEAKEYQELVYKAVYGDAKANALIADKERPQDIYEARTKLYWEIIQTKQECMETLGSNKKMIKSINEAIVHVHRTRCPGSLLTAQFKEAVLKQVPIKAKKK